MRDLKAIVEVITQYLEETQLNRVPELGNMKIYDGPLVGLANAEDPLFDKLKEPSVIGPHHLNPQEWLPGAQTVISYFLPFNETVRKSNRLDHLPSKEWLYGRYEGELCNDAVRRFLKEEIEKMGGKAVIPVQDARFQVIDKRSNWSERHAAFIAGLGTFGLSKSLITEKGCAGRYGSIVVNLRFEPTPRSYLKIDEYCTKCGACIDRCPAGAITEAGKAHEPCSRFVDDTKVRFAPRYGCGKCQTGVPCENTRP
ncbi:epoxyqueuosine reductase [Thermanaerosceptrum fracticalcis]|uniref:Epoxyqueuosine reductase n=1 Tax=Thermanaerosceptrum fracticalcis TaxID=1712410 RepID=A0A7G6DYV7_THEFR|nr:4Fe-4S binding protein [Thermanaerosceptrum fracticalcis]QNB45011.1 epoxyqueuosine reductase [Thermanaerosceptrum fracticalcis]